MRQLGGINTSQLHCSANHKGPERADCCACQKPSCQGIAQCLFLHCTDISWQMCELGCAHRYQKQFQADPAAYQKPSKDSGGYWIAKVSPYLASGLLHHQPHSCSRLASPAGCSKSTSDDALTHSIHLHICRSGSGCKPWPLNYL